MKKLSKEQCAQRDEIAGRLRSRFSDLDLAVEAYNSAVEAAWAKVEETKNDYNEAIADANEWQQDVAADIQSYMDDRSEKWLEGEKGQAYESWRSEYEQEFPTADLDKPDELSTSDIEDAAEIIEQRQMKLYEGEETEEI